MRWLARCVLYVSVCLSIWATPTRPCLSAEDAEPGANRSAMLVQRALLAEAAGDGALRRELLYQAGCA